MPAFRKDAAAPKSRPRARRSAGGATQRLPVPGLVVLLAAAAVVLVFIPYVIAPFYRFIDPISTPMLWRYATGARVERSIVPLSHIASPLRLVVIVAEDGSFCRNRGIDLGAMREALRQADDSPAAPASGGGLGGGRARGKASGLRGASTITQQTAKNLFLWQGRSFVRKALEIPLALWINLVLPKRRVLEIYLNVVEWGPDGEFGAEAAARYAFGASARELSARQAAELAAILPNPLRRSARTPSALVRRLAALYERRAADYPGRGACIRAP